jgi:hypothetical protein
MASKSRRPTDVKVIPPAQGLVPRSPLIEEAPLPRILGPRRKEVDMAACSSCGCSSYSSFCAVGCWNNEILVVFGNQNVNDVSDSKR